MTVGAVTGVADVANCASPSIDLCAASANALVSADIAMAGWLFEGATIAGLTMLPPGEGVMPGTSAILLPNEILDNPSRLEGRSPGQAA